MTRPSKPAVRNAVPGRRSLPVIAIGVVAIAVAVSVIAAVAVWLVTRDDGSDAPVSGTVLPLTDEQAGRLSQVLSKNFELQGATFTAAAPVQAGMTLQLAGEVDWVKHLGHAAVTWQGNPAPGRVVEVFWSEREVLERLPGLGQALTAAGKPSAGWTARPVDTTTYAIDRVIELVTKLASQQRDNPVLLQQHGGTGWLRADTLRGSSVDVFAYSEQVRHWVGADDGRLLRVEANIGGFPQATVVDLLVAGQQTVLGPKTADVVPIADVREVYERLNPPPR